MSVPRSVALSMLLLLSPPLARLAPAQEAPARAAAALAPGCNLLSAPGATAALCETFDQPAGIGNRSGDLNGTLWGVSRQLGAVNSGQGQWYDVSPTIRQKCGQSIQVLPPNDVAICNGRLVEAQSDQGGVTSLAMYPKQPFDIAGRTGTIAFDVSDDSHGSHRGCALSSGTPISRCRRRSITSAHCSRCRGTDSACASGASARPTCRAAACASSVPTNRRTCRSSPSIRRSWSTTTGATIPSWTSAPARSRCRRSTA